VSVRAEWMELRTEPGQLWSAAATGVLLVAGAVVWSNCAAVPRCPAVEAECVVETVDIVRLSLSGVQLAQFAVIVLAVLVTTDEYATGLIHSTLIATPRRLTVLASKAMVVTAAALAGGASGVHASLPVARVVLAGNGFTTANGYPPVSLADGPTMRAAGGSILYLGLIALLSIGIGLAVRHSLAALTVVVCLLYGLPLVGAALGNAHLQRFIAKYAPLPAGLSIQDTRRLDELVIGGWPGLGVVAVWASVAMLVGAIAFAVRDA
jgi:hypothetical protein